LEIAALRGDAPLPESLGYPAPVLGIQLVVDNAELVRRIAARARGQFDGGLVEEARALRTRWDPALPAFSAIGYRESWAVLDGDATLEEAIDLDARRNVAFSKRQRTWFRREPDLAVVDATHDPAPIAIAALDRFVEAVGERGAGILPSP
jgi:tRNA A37 N6-isopentenylltransferase MiaA